MTLAILSALPEEQHGIADALQHVREVRRAGRNFVCGQWQGHEVVLGLTGIGKVAAATTATAMLEFFGAQKLVFTGVAGGIGEGVQVGDVIVAQHFLQHDMDVRPLFSRWQVPGYDSLCFACNQDMVQMLQTAAQSCTAVAATWQEPLLQGRQPRVHTGLIVSGDQFIVSAETSRAIHGDLMAVGLQPLAVEMEGAAIAQVCADYQVPFAAVRTVSDRADDDAHTDFPAFVQQVASRYAQHIIRETVAISRI
ncbi:MAG: 5'-methylthioadenosine/adenosylhomocysteine nucleosidase [Comamonadaceae bacterium]|nr:5'-methylthioadenosine/adenosylhomocysteine nucleosidase [Comamonadaceae bacterium]